jgi:molecular chaperone GrpE
MEKEMTTGNSENPETEDKDLTEQALNADKPPARQEDDTSEDADEVAVQHEDVQESDDLPAAIDSEASVFLDLEKARAEASEYLQLAKRTQADLINYRKRVESERESFKQFAIEDLIFELVPVLDSLAQAEHMYQDTPAGENPLLDGVRKTREMLHKVLLEHGIQTISEAKVPFNPSMHQPLHSEPSPDVVVEMVAEVYQQGVRIGDRVIKPAMVKVLTPVQDSKGEDEPVQEEPEEDAPDEEE